MHVEGELGLTDGATRAFNALRFDEVGAMAKASGIDEAEGEAAVSEGLLDGVAGSSSGGTNDGAVVGKQGVE